MKWLLIINKAVDGVWSQLLSDPRFQDQISYEMVKNTVINYFVDTINASRSHYDRFDYQTTRSFSTALHRSKLLNQLVTTPIKQEIITLKRAEAEVFLKNYENKIRSLERLIARMGTDSNNKTIKIEELKQFKNAVEKIKSQNDDITILYPPISFYRELTEQQITTIKKMKLNSKNKVVAGIQKYIQSCELDCKFFEKLAREIDPQLCDIEKIEHITRNLNNDSLGKKISEVYLSTLVSHLISQVDIQNLAFPLANKKANIIESLINLKQYLDKNKEKIALDPEIKKRLDSQDIKKLQHFLEDTHKLEHYNRLQKKTVHATPSAVSKYLTEQDHSFLYLYNKIVTYENSSTSMERNELSIMLENCIGDLDFNKRLELLAKKDGFIESKYRYTLPEIKYFTCITKKMV